MSTAQEVPQGQASEGAEGAAEKSQPAAQVRTPVPGWLGKDHGLSEDQVGWIQRWGYQGLPDVIKSTMALERIKGARAEEIVRIPRDESDWGEVWNRLGRPEKPDGYKLPERQLSQGAIDLRPMLLPKAHEVGLSQKQVEALDGHLNQVFEGVVQRADEEFRARVARETSEVRAEWGEQYEHRFRAASAAVEKLREASGLELSEKQLEAVEKAMGSAWLTKLMYGVARMAGGLAEARFVEGERPDGSMGMSPAAAAEAVERMKADPKVREALTAGRSHPGYAAANRELVRLSKIAAGEG
jgi:hypothetical protein